MLESNVNMKPVFDSEQKELIQTKKLIVTRRKLDASKYGIKTKKKKKKGQQKKNWFHNDDLIAVDSFSVHLPKSVLFFELDIIKKKN